MCECLEMVDNFYAIPFENLNFGIDISMSHIDSPPPSYILKFFLNLKVSFKEKLKKKQR